MPLACTCGAAKGEQTVIRHGCRANDAVESISASATTLLGTAAALKGGVQTLTRTVTQGFSSVGNELGSLSKRMQRLAEAVVTPPLAGGGGIAFSSRKRPATELAASGGGGGGSGGGGGGGSEAAAAAAAGAAGAAGANMEEEEEEEEEEEGAGERVGGAATLHRARAPTGLKNMSAVKCLALYFRAGSNHHPSFTPQDKHRSAIVVAWFCACATDVEWVVLKDNVAKGQGAPVEFTGAGAPTAVAIHNVICDRLAACFVERNTAAPDALIKRDELMATSIQNRVKKLRELSNPSHRSFTGVKLPIGETPAAGEYLAWRKSNEQRIAAAAAVAADAAAQAAAARKARLAAQASQPAAAPGGNGLLRFFMLG
jgi:hypothetical protein